MLPGAGAREAGQGEEFIPRDSSRVEMSGEAPTPQAIAGKLHWRKDLHMLRRLWRETGVKMEWDKRLGRWVMAESCDFKRFVLILQRFFRDFFPSAFPGRREMAVVMPP